MNSESMLARLDRYYHEQSISANDFKCKHLHACRSVCKPGEMVSLPEAYVGPQYEAKTLPRLLFVSSDTNAASWRKEYFTGWGSLMDIREDKLQHHKRAPANRHWGQTLNLAGALLAPFALKCLSKGIDQDKIVEYIAHANSTRCKDSSIKKGEGKEKMYLNCRGYIKDEVVVMQPDIIVTQGVRARGALKDVFPVIQHIAMPGYPETFWEIVQLEESHRALKIVAKHPCARGEHGWKSGEKKQFIEWATKSVQEFILGA